MPSKTSSCDLPDVNVLLAVLSSNHVAHDIAWAWFQGVQQFATTPVTELGLLRLSLNPKVMGHPVAASAALASLHSLRGDPRAIFLHDDASLDDALVDLAGLRGHRQVTDLHLVNLAAKHALTLVTLDASLQRSLTTSDQEHVRLIG